MKTTKRDLSVLLGVSLMAYAFGAMALAQDSCAKKALNAAKGVERINSGGDVGENSEVKLTIDSNGSKSFTVSFENAAYEVQTSNSCTIRKVTLTRED